MEKIIHYHILIIDSAAHASLLPYLHEASWVKPLLHADQTHARESERLACVAVAHRSFDEILEALELKVHQLQTQWRLHLPIPYQVATLTLPQGVPGLRLDFTNASLAHEALLFLCDGLIQPITTQDDTGGGSGPSTRSELPSPGHTFIHPSLLKFVPYR
jgi:hypothetical protein